jgi:hypothetical protein
VQKSWIQPSLLFKIDSSTATLLVLTLPTTLKETKAMIMTDNVGESLLSFKRKNDPVSGNRATNVAPKVAVISTEEKVVSMKGKGVKSSEKSTKHKQDSVPTVTASSTQTPTPNPDLAKSECGILGTENIADNLDVVIRRGIPGFVNRLVDSKNGHYFHDVGDRLLTRENNKVGEKVVETLIDVVNAEPEYQSSVGARKKQRKVDQTQSRTNHDEDTGTVTSSTSEVLIQQCCHEVSDVMVQLATKVNEKRPDSECEELFTAANVFVLELIKARFSDGYKQENTSTHRS